MHGLGNDYLYVYGDVPADIAALSIRLSDRHCGAGADGMIYIGPSKTADFSMRIFNADGSEAMMCGNGIRCVGKYVYDKGYTDKTKLTVETLSGIKTLHLTLKKGVVDRVTVGMGQAVVSPQKEVEAGGKKVVCTPVSVGNPHAVIFVDNAETAPVEALGRLLEKNSASGITMACGTGACASAAAAVSLGSCAADTPIAVHLDGGTLEITVGADGSITMTGPAAFVYEGETIPC